MEYQGDGFGRRLFLFVSSARMHPSSPQATSGAKLGASIRLREETKVRISRILVACCAALLIAGTAAAEIGTFSFSYSVMPIGDTQIDITLTSSTAGATTTTSYEGLSNSAWIYGPVSTGTGTWEYRSSITLNSTTGPPYAMRLTSNFSFTGLTPGSYTYWVGGWAWYRTYSTYYSTYTWVYPEYEYATGSALLGVDVPTAGQYGLMLLGLALAASGVILLRRA